MFGIGISKEEIKTQAAIQRRQRLEAERKERIFNPKRRQIGVRKNGIILIRDTSRWIEV